MQDKCEIIWDTSKPAGDKKRLMSTKRAQSIGITSQVSLKQGIKNTIEWYLKNKDKENLRYNAFTDKVYK